tara:strand:+ start:1184 stop:1663 length:480 start_codon:yes stop_codon:yes gene_type:complete
MKLLVAGGAGYIGSHVVLEALDGGFKVTILDNLSSGNRENIPEGAHFFQGSTQSNSDLSKLFNSNKYNAVVHLAASKASGESMVYPGKYAQNNISEGLNFINACCESKVSTFVFSTSAAVYGSPKYNPIDEDHPILPTSYYGFLKSILEHNLNRHSNLR